MTSPMSFDPEQEKQLYSEAFFPNSTPTNYGGDRRLNELKDGAELVVASAAAITIGSVALVAVVTYGVAKETINVVKEKIPINRRPTY